MKINFTKWLFGALTLLPSVLFGQLTVTNGYTAQQLGNNLAGNNVNVFNATITGNANQRGLFQYTGTDLGLNSGVILSTGNVFQAVGPNNDSGTSTGYNGPGDPDLTALAGFQTNDAVVFEFDFEVTGDEIEFNFVFLSEEYNEFVNSGFNDVFAFYISGPGITGQENLAIVPGTTTPVTINTINNGSFWQFYNDNSNASVNIEFDGFTTLMKAKKSGLQQCGIYTLSLRIADGSDNILDSGVLLQENSLVQSNVSATSNTFSGNNTALEGCIEASFTFAIDSALNYDITIPIGIGGTATNGVDYAFVDSLITIPAGQLSSTLIIDAVADGLAEGQETIELYFEPAPCEPIDTVYLYIDDYTPLEYEVNPTNVTCAGADNGTVDLTVSGGLPPYFLTLTDSVTGVANTYNTLPVTGLAPGTYFVDVIDSYGCSAADVVAGNIFDAGTTFIPDGQGGSYSTTINLGGFGASQTIQSADQIQSICATLEHSRIGELEITLTAPNGQMVTLKEQPGGAVTNFGEPCAVGPTDGGGGNSNTDPGIGYNYCWQAQSTYLTMVQEANNYTYTYTNPCDGSTQSDKYLPTGSYQPYESFANFIGAPLNGGWTITVTDHIPNNNGYIFDWSIVLQADPPDSIFTITEPVGPTISHTVVQPSCGGTNGSINLTVTGGTGPFTYLWSNGATTQDIASLTAGVYTVTVSDATGCSYNYQVNLSSNGALAITGVASNQSCFGLNNGSINVTVSGASGSPSFSWNTGQTTEDISSLQPGNYTITVNDGNCQGITTFTVGAAPQINISGTVTNENCGDQEGTVNITTFGTVAPVTYAWSNGATTEDIAELQQGTYTVQLTDGNSCTAAATYQVINLVGNCVPDCDLAVTNQVLTNESCGNANGAINLTVFSTNGPIQFSWNNGSTNEDLSNLQAGSYTVTITDNEGCVLNQNYTLSNQTGTLSIAGINTINENCGNGQGGADATVTGGLLPYTYSWSNGASTQDLTGVSAGTYALTVTDATGCSAYQSVTVQNVTSGITQTYGNAVDEICSNGTGSIDIQISGGQLPYSYTWSNGATTQDQTGLSAGTYSCVITDANGCSISTPVYSVNNQSGNLAFSNIDADNEVCSNAGGDIAISVTGGTSPYTYLWNNGATTEDIAGLTAGTYSLTVTDNGGCSINSGNLVVINESGTLNLTSVATFDELCSNGTGSINITTIGGTAPLSYSWSNGSTSQDLTNLSAGEYICTITDVNNCSVEVSASIFNDPGALNIDNLVVTNETCGNSNGAINLIVSGAATPVIYAWSNGPTTQDLTNIAAGNYTVTLTDNNGCTTSGTAFVSNDANGLTVDNAVVIGEVCNDNNGSVNLTVSGGVAPLTYSWSNGQTTEDVTGLNTGTYTCEITDANGCSTISGPYSIVNSSGTLNATITATGNETCNNNAGSVSITTSGGTSPFTFSWSNGGTTEDLSGLTAGTYALTVTDAAGCQDQVQTEVFDLPGTMMISALAISDEICNNNQGAINISVSGGSGVYTYLWSNGATTQDLVNLNQGTYSVTISDGSGCSLNSGSLTVNNNSGNFDVTAINVTNEVCGDGTGYVDLIVTGATGTINYNWSTGAATQDISNLSAGSYSGTATDQAGCSISFSASVSDEPGNLIATYASTPATCFNNNGAINLTLSGGLNPITYLWSNGATTEDISGLNAGNYTVNIADGNGCSLNNTISVAETGGPQISGVSITDETCGNANGSIQLNVSGGTAPYTYNWTGTSSNPCCTYTLDMQDQGNSWNGASIDVIVDGGFAGNFTVFGGGANTGTFNVCDGQTIDLIWNSGGFDNETSFDLLDGAGNIVFSHNAGTAPTPGTIYTGTASCSAQPLNGSSVNNLTAGVYSVVVTDGNGCVDSTTITVNNTSGNLQIDALVTNETCSDANGAIDVTLSGNPPFTFTWSNGATTQDLSGLTAGTYTMTISDQSGCSTTESFTITNITNGLALASSTITDENCGDGTGAISITTVGGQGPLSYFWNNGFTAQNISGLNAGTYTVTIADGSACDLVETFEVGNITGTLAVTEVVTNETCSNANGAINLTITGGTAPYSVLWSNNQSTEDLSGISGGTYSVTVTDAAGCAFTNDFIVNTINLIVLTATTAGDNCLNGTGSINLSVSGGTTPYTYNWSNGATTQDLNNLDYGTYSVTVTDNSGCSALATYNVASSGNIAAPTVVIGNEICGNSNGSINLTWGGGPGTPGSYTWSNGATTQDITNLSSGLYWVEYSTFGGPGGGCTEVDTFFVGANQGNLSIDSILVINESCSQSNGSLNAYISGGTAPLSFQWTNGSITEDLTGLQAGTYMLTVTDNNGCEVTETVIVDNYTYGFGVSAAIINDENCGDASGSINLTINGGVPAYTYNWSNGETTEDISGLAAGIYIVTVTDANGCSVSNSFTVENFTNGFEVFSLATNETCGNLNGAIDLTITGGVSPITFNWSNGATSEDILGLTGGTFTCQITDNTGCVLNVNETILSLSPNFDIGTAVILDENCGDGTGSITLSPTGGANPLTYDWNIPAPCCSYTLNMYDLNNNGWGGTPAPGVIVYINGAVYGTFMVPVGTGNSIATEIIPVCSGDEISFEYSPSAQNGNNTYEVLDADGNVIFSDGPNAPSGIAFTTNATCSAPNANTLTGLNAGIYDVVVTDTNGCSVSGSYTVNNVTGTFAVSATVTDATCSGANGTIDITSTGGNAPYNYEWSNLSNSEDQSALTAGAYNVTVTDASGCQITENYTVVNASTAPDVVSTNATNATCPTCTEGSVDITMGGASAPYTYNWSNGATSEDVIGLIPGTYSVTITNADGCQTILDFTVLNTASLNEFNESIFQIVPNPSNGQITLVHTNANFGKTVVTVTDAAGRKVFRTQIVIESTVSHHELDLSGLSMGTYLITLEAEGQQNVQRIVIK